MNMNAGEGMQVLGAHSAPARERRGASGPPQATEPGSGAEPRSSWMRRSILMAAAFALFALLLIPGRSEERRVGKECRL